MRNYNNALIFPCVAGLIATVACCPAAAKDASPEAAYKNALFVWKNGNQRKAEALANQYTVAFPSDQKIALFEAVCIRSRFKVDIAMPLFIRIVSREKANQRSGTEYSLQAQCALAILAIDGRRSPETGLKVLRDVARQNPSDPMPVWLLAIACRTLNRDEEGIVAYRRLLNLARPGSSLVHQTFANMLDKTGKHEDALRSRYITVELEPASWSYDGLANTLIRMGRVDEALKYQYKSVAMAPGSARGWYNLGTYLYDAQRYTEAEKALQRAVNLAPDNPDFVFNLGLSLELQKKFSDASKVFAKYCEAKPEDLKGWEHWGDCLYGLNDYNGALDKYKTIERRGETDPALYGALYLTLHQLGREQEALRYKAMWKRDKKT
ncbi:MAG: tetratricopeptide repeat protein [Akkermansiaceae bacterium]|nr:tetratricopeptide repeat protein [Armatimonadota bacterium]